MRFGSLFSGIGAFDTALEEAGMQAAFQVEIDRDCNRVLKHHWPSVRRENDVTTSKGKGRGRLPAVSLLCGGFPCQDLSLAGKRAGLVGKRSGLFFEFVRLAREIAPRWVLLENVPGLLSSNRGRDMGTILWHLGQLGYGWAYRVLDSQYFGLAQRRRRVFIVGCLGDAARAAAVLFEPESCAGDSAPGRETAADIAGTIGSGAPGSGWRDDLDRSGAFVTHTLRSEGADADAGGSTWREGRPTLPASDDNGTNQAVAAFITPRLIRNSGSCNEWGVKAGDTADTLQSDGPGAICAPCLRSNAYNNSDPTMEAQMLQVQNGTAGLMTVRRLTPTERLRLQGLPDDWLDLDPPLSDSAKYRMVGNAVSKPPVAWIGRRIMEQQ